MSGWHTRIEELQQNVIVYIMEMYDPTLLVLYLF